MILKIAEYGAAVIGTHYFACLIQMVLHARLGHRRSGGTMFRAHLRNHHAIYSSLFTAPAYIQEDESLTVFYLAPIAACALLAFGLLPRVLAIVVTTSFLVSLAAHVFLHVQYHLESSALRRFQWFRSRQNLHRLHHEQPNKNFGVVEFVWDRLLGTYTDEDFAMKGLDA
jgi:sterol desaturase/sphingolipid hydroxylase (fatty acid hydroxylase superfamily)